MAHSKSSLFSVLIVAAMVSACTTPSPYEAPEAPGTPEATQPAVETQPGTPPTTVPEPQPLPEPAQREPTLSPATRALVSQAQSQAAGRNYPVAAATIERALRIEPGNPLLWLELGRIRQAEGNYVQAENMARKAVSMSVQAPRTQAAAWQLVAESYRARGKNVEARAAEHKANSVIRR